MNITPIPSLPGSSLQGLGIAKASNTTLTISAGSAWDSTNTFSMVLAADTTLDAATNGVNGLDTGSLAASTLYYIFEISDKQGYNPTGVIASTSATPYMPEGYSLIRRIGWAWTDASSHFLNLIQTGGSSNSAVRHYAFPSPVSVLSGGTSATYVAIDLSGAVPAPLVQTKVDLFMVNNPNAAGDATTFSLDGTNTLFDVKGTDPQDGALTGIPTANVSSLPKIYYKVTASGSLTLSVMGFEDYL